MSAARETARAWTPGRAAATIERAVAFIRQRVRLHEMEFSLEVGRHLFEKVYDGNRALFRQGGSDRAGAISRIAADRRVRIGAAVLYKCIHVYLLDAEHRVARPDLPVPDLEPWTWDELWALEGDAERLVVVAAWAARERVPRETVARVAQLVGPYVGAGGRIEDLFAPVGPFGGEGKGKGGGGGGGQEPWAVPTTPYGKMRRLLGVAEKRIEAAPITGEERARALGIAGEILSALGQAGGR